MDEKQANLKVVGNNEIDQLPIQVPKPEEKPNLEDCLAQTFRYVES